MSPHAHRNAVWLMIAATVLWSIAGVFTRHLETARSFEVTFWRSAFAALFLLLFLLREHRLRAGAFVCAMGWGGLVSAAMWAVMFTCFMLALTLTSTANTLIVMSLYPLLAALLAWWILGERIAPRTGLAIAAAFSGIGWMFAHGLGNGSRNDTLGMLVALGTPFAASINVVTLRKLGAAVDLVPAVLLGGLISAVLTLPFAWPMQASARDLAILATLGVLQLGLPCILMIRAARALSSSEVALLSLLEVVLGPLWAWLGAGEVPTASTVSGGMVVLAALVINELAPGTARPARAEGT
jgi:drug/metabolite transporter (DMT)-like permease